MKFIRLLPLFLVSLSAAAADNYVQVVCNNSLTGVDTVSITGVVANNTLVAFAFNGSSATTPPTVGDGQNAAWPAKGSAVLDATNLVAEQTYELDAATSGTHTVTTNNLGVVPGFLCVVEVGTTAATPFSGAVGQHQSSPGTGSGAVSTTNVTTTRAATLVSISTDTSIISISDAPTAVSGTSRNSGSNTAVGSWSVQTQTASTNAAGTFTAIVGTDDFITAGISIFNASAATGPPPAGVFVTLP